MRAIAEASRGFDLLVLSLSDESTIQGGLIRNQDDLEQIAGCSMLIVHCNPHARCFKPRSSAETRACADLSGRGRGRKLRSLKAMTRALTGGTGADGV